MSQETEAKFSVFDLVSFNQIKALRQLAGFTLTDGEEVAVQDVYQDTAGRSLLAAGWALRFRSLRGKVLVTAKRLAPSSGPVHDREELEIALESPVQPSEWPDGDLRRMVLALTGEGPLVALFEVHQQRFVRNLVRGERVGAELSLDRVRLLAGGQEREYLELEIELLPAGTRDELFSMLGALEKELSLVPSSRSKFEEGLLLLDGNVFLPENRRSPRLRRPPRPTAPTGDVEGHLETPPETTEETVEAELSRLGYRFRVRSRKEETRAYFDTQSGSLFKQDIELYFSQEDSRWYLLRQGRQVHSQRGASDAPPTAGAVAQALQAATRTIPIIPCLEATVRETVLTLASISGPSLGLVFRTWQLRSPLHVVPGQSALTLAFTRRGSSPFELDYLAGLLRTSLDLRDIDGPQIKFGLARLGVPLPGAPLPSGFLPSVGDDLAVMCRKILSGEAWRMKANTPGAVRNLDPEFVHDLRVATRRARFACRLFVAALGIEGRHRIRTELSWIAGLLGSVRDLDVLRARLESQLSLVEADQTFRAAVTEVLETRAHRARDLLVGALGSQRYSALLEMMASAVPGSSADAPAGGKAADEFGHRRIAKALGRIAPWTRRNPEELSSVELHRLRILFKRLRYTAEFFRPILEERASLLAKECVAYQDCLGLHQDARVAVDVLLALAEEPSLRERAEGLLALGALIQVQRDVMSAQRERFRELWGSVGRLFDLWAGRPSEVRR